MAISLEWDAKATGSKVDGWTSKYIDDLNNMPQAGMSSRVFIKDSSFLMPKSHTTPIIMVGPGTGIVPFIGFIEERTVAKNNGE